MPPDGRFRRPGLIPPPQRPMWLLGALSAPDAPPGSFPPIGCESGSFQTPKQVLFWGSNYRLNRYFF